MDLTVITMVDSQRERGARALHAFCAQSIVERMEILVVDFGAPDLPPLQGCNHPSVRVLPAEKTMGYGHTLAMAVAQARAPIVAIVEEHVIVLEGWAQALVEAHKGPWAAVGSEMHPGDLDRPASRRIELVSRHHWSVPARRGESPMLRWQNVSYKRASLMRYGDKLPLYLGSESMLFRQMRRDGERLFVEPAARMVHAHEHRWGAFLLGSLHSARLNAARAAVLAGAGPIARLVQAARCLAGAVRWPWVLWRRTRSLPNPEQWMPVFYRSLFFVVEYYAVHALAGALGALAGEGDSDRQFLSYEINEGRWRPTLSQADTLPGR
jgi:hypothetical protein